MIRFCSGRPYRTDFKRKRLLWRHFSSLSGNPTGPKPQNLPIVLPPISLKIKVGVRMSDESRDKKIQKKKKEKEKGRRWVITVIFLTFVISALLQMVQAGLMSRVNLAMAFVILIVFVLVGILFDIIGVAVTSANEIPFHSLSSQKIRGAKEAVRLIRSADRVGSFCNDVIGDIVGIISGSATTVIVAMILSSGVNVNNFLMTTLMTAIVAALTIGGKAAGKRIAIDKSNEIVFFVGKTISFIAPVK